MKTCARAMPAGSGSTGCPITQRLNGRGRTDVVPVGADTGGANDGEAVPFADGARERRVSPGACGHRAGATIALCYLADRRFAAGAELGVAVAARPRRAVILVKPSFDAEGERPGA